MARGGYTFSQIKEMSLEERMFIHHYQNLSEDNQMRTLLKALGVIWEKDDFLREPSVSENRENTSRDVFIPLAMTINPNIHKFVGDTAKKSNNNGISPKYYGSGELIEQSLGKVRSMAELSKEEFYQMIGRPIPSKIK